MRYDPSIYPYDHPFPSASSGVAKLLQQQHQTLIENSQDRQIQSLSMRNSCLSEQLHEAQKKLSKYEKEQPVEIKTYWWHRFANDPFWEIFKRPLLK